MKKDKQIIKHLLQNKTNYIFIPLQVHDDFQILEHSKYNNIEEFIKEVLLSFSKTNRNDLKLLFKHHPMDRGIKNYTKYINELSSELNIGDHVISIYEGHIPTLLKNSKGCLTVNSTVGLSSLYHKVKTKVIGKAIYKLDGICYDKDLNEFWIDDNFSFDYEEFKIFYNYLKIKTQINDSFYKKY